jgi:hypothetical protein
MRLLRSLLFFVVVLWPAGPGAAATAPALVPPPGWVEKSMSVPPPIQMIGVWVAPVAKNGTTESINLLSEHASLPFDAYIETQRAYLLKTFTDSFAQDADEDCVTAKAHRFEYVTTFGNHTYDITQLVRIVEDNGYTATYTRPSGSPADPAALTSLRTLCSTPISVRPGKFVQAAALTQPGSSDIMLRNGSSAQPLLLSTETLYDR